MAKLLNPCLLFTFIQFIFFGFQANAVPYDYSFTPECLAKPVRPQYDGGIVVNPEFNEGLTGWTSFGNVAIEQVKSQDGNNYIVAFNRNQSFQSFAQTFHLETDKIYTFSAWLQLSHGNADVSAIFKKRGLHFVTAGWGTAQGGCWTMLKGGFIANTSGPAQLFFESKNNKEVDIWADNISLQPFTQEEWASHQQLSLEKVRKSKVKLEAVDQQGQPIPNATVSMRQRKPSFPFGMAINQHILNTTAYQNWFTSRGFKYTVFENELKWYDNEKSQGTEDYSRSDALLRFAQSQGIAVRGHNVFWEDPTYQPRWVHGLSPNDLWAAAKKRIQSVMARYRGQLFHWDVVNENLHFNFFETRLGDKATRLFYRMANRIDSKTIPFLNDYNTLESGGDRASPPFKYLRKVRDLRKHGYCGPLGIGLEGHFFSWTMKLAYIRSALDQIATAGLPIWITELDVASTVPDQAWQLEQILDELHSHPAVQGIIIWGAWSPEGCYRMCLTDNNFKNLATGNVVDRFSYRLRNEAAVDAFVSATADSNGIYESWLYHGEYEVKISNPNGEMFSDLQQINVVPGDKAENVFRFTTTNSK